MLQQTQVTRVVTAGPPGSSAGRRRVAGRRDAGRGAAGLAGHGLQPPRPQPPPRVEGRRRGRLADDVRGPAWRCPAWGPTPPPRWRCRRSEPTSCRSTSTSAACWSAASARTDLEPPPGRASDFLQALFDLGATVCVARVPRCDRCPLAAGCPSRGRRYEPARRQGRFEGSRRQARGRLLDRRAHGAGRAAGRRPGVVEALVRDGLAVVTNGVVTLPSAMTPPAYATNALRCLGVREGERFQMLCDELTYGFGLEVCAAAAGLGAMPDAHGLPGVVAAADASRPRPSSPRSRRRTRSCSGSATADPAEVVHRRGLYSAVEASGRARLAFGANIDAGVLEHEMAADYAAIEERCRALPRRPRRGERDPRHRAVRHRPARARSTAASGRSTTAASRRGGG